MLYPTAVIIFGVALTILFIAIISLWWQISAHSAGVGGVVSALLVLNYKYEMPPLYWASLVAIVLAGAVMTSRLKLNAHTLAQVIAGFFVGFLVGLGSYFLL